MLKLILDQQLQTRCFLFLYSTQAFRSFYMVHKISWVNLIKINGLLMIKVWVSKFLDFKSIYGERDKIFALLTLFAGISYL